MMQVNVNDRQALRKYLLGNLPVEEQEQFELWLMSDDEAYDLVEAAEDDLIDESLSGKLKGRELHQFNTHFLAAPERKRKLRFGKSLARYIEARTAPKTVSFGDVLRAFLAYRPSVAYAAAALIVVMVGGVIWSIQRQTQLQHRLDSVMSQLSEMGR